jgi:predicted amidohydrolase YtcJ
METDWQDQANVGIRRGFGSAFLRLGALKGYVDGTLQSSTALFFEPYGDAPGSTGMLTEEFTPFEDARTRLASADASGLQIALHAVGDRGVSMALDLYEELGAVDPARDRRLRIEHAQHLVDADFDRFAELEVIASVQPYQAVDQGRWAEARIGSERARGSYAYQTLLDRGARLALGTDWDAGPLDPMLTLHAAVTRATLDGSHPDGWMPAQKLTLEDAVEAYTLGSAYAEFQESEKGSVTVGKLADLVMLDADIFAIDPDDLPTVSVVTTIVGGRVVYTAGAP